VLCLSREGRTPAKAIFDMARNDFRTEHIVVVTQADESEEWRELLALGPDDFMTPPFRPVDVLPRLWRLHPGSSEGDPVVLHLKEKLGLKQFKKSRPLPNATPPSHVQRYEGNLFYKMRRGRDSIGYLQLADSPDRNEPGTGEVNYTNVIELCAVPAGICWKCL
jgi:hypothetical protein